MQSTYQQQTFQTNKNSLLSQNNFPYTNQFMNLPRFAQDNIKLYISLLEQIYALKLQNGQQEKNRAKSVNKIPVLTKTKSGLLSENEQKSLTQIQIRNQFLRNELDKLKKNNSDLSLSANPKIKSKYKQLCDRKKQIEDLQRTNKQLKAAMKAGDLFEMYQAMCRQCEGLRKVNNQLSQQIKTTIVKINQITGKQQNPNVFLMNIK